MDRSMKQICGKTEDDDDMSSNNNVVYNRVTLSKILMRLDPCNLFKFILVSKYWLSVISDPVFRTYYLNTWKNSGSKVVGLLLHEYDEAKNGQLVQLLATGNVGRDINERTLRPLTNGYFISKSSKGGLLLVGVNDSKKWYVCKSISGSPLVELPELRYYTTAYFMANIICDDNEGVNYKVVLADFHFDKEVRFLIYCSRTKKWEESMCTCSRSLHKQKSDFVSMVHDGIVDAVDGVIYYNVVNTCHVNYLAAWDINGRSIRVVPVPPPSRAGKQYSARVGEECHTTYGVSSQPHASLIAASSQPYEGFSWDFAIKIWALGSDKKSWRALHTVKHASIWTKNLPLLTTLFEYKPIAKGFTFVSFVPGRSDSCFLGLEQHLFVYHFHTGKLEHVEYLKYGSTGTKFTSSNTCHPLTVLDLGIWPSFPASLQLSHCS